MRNRWPRLGEPSRCGALQVATIVVSVTSGLTIPGCLPRRGVAPEAPAATTVQRGEVVVDEESEEGVGRDPGAASRG